MKIAVAGTGYVGLSIVAVTAPRGHGGGYYPGEG